MFFVSTTRSFASAEAVFDWHEALGAFERLTPPWERVRMVRHKGGIRDGARVSLRVGPPLVFFRWDLEHVDYQHGRSFMDRQVRGPFHSWTHVRRMTTDGLDACILEDAIEYELPFGAVGRVLGRPFVKWKLKRLFEFRHKVIRRALEPR
jgi:ligand-binding SRPBCC domain-containing protein